jgi:hypothetical protein
MTTQTKTPSLEEFLTVTAGSKEVGLIIAKDTSELEGFVQSLDEMGFKRSEKAADLSKFPNSYLVIDEGAAKDAYDFAVQYPSGQVEIFNKEQMQSQSFSPDYSSLNLVLLVVKDDLNKLQTKGFDLLSAVGPAFQS